MELSRKDFADDVRAELANGDPVVSYWVGIGGFEEMVDLKIIEYKALLNGHKKQVADKLIADQKAAIMVSLKEKSFMVYGDDPPPVPPPVPPPEHIPHPPLPTPTIQPRFKRDLLELMVDNAQEFYPPEVLNALRKEAALIFKSKKKCKTTEQKPVSTRG